MLYENKFEKISKISSNPFIKDLIELNIIESADDLSFSDYLLLWLLTIEKLPSNEKKMEGNDFVDDYIEVNETITEEEYWNIMKRLEDSGFTIIKVLFEHAAFLITVRSKTGKLYKFKVFCKGGATVDDYEGNDYSESENDNEDSWGLGAQYWAEHPHVAGYKPLFGILLDMVGSEDATFTREYYSMQYANGFVDLVWKCAAGSHFINAQGGAVTDDHIFINRAGIPCIDIIDMRSDSETGFCPEWHTVDDTIGNISPATLAEVGQTLLNVIAQLEQ